MTKLYGSPMFSGPADKEWESKVELLKILKNTVITAVVLVTTVMKVNP